MYSWKQRLRRDDRHSSHGDVCTLAAVHCKPCWCSPDLGLQSTGGLLLSVGLLLKYPLLPQLLMLLLRTADTIFISLVGLTASRDKTKRERELVPVIKPFPYFLKKTKQQQAMLSLTTLGIG